MQKDLDGPKTGLIFFKENIIYHFFNDLDMFLTRPEMYTHYWGLFLLVSSEERV